MCDFIKRYIIRGTLDFLETSCILAAICAKYGYEQKDKRLYSLYDNFFRHTDTLLRAGKRVTADENKLCRTTAEVRLSYL